MKFFVLNRTGMVTAAQLLEQFLVAVDNPLAALHPRFGVKNSSGVCSSVRARNRHVGVT